MSKQDRIHSRTPADTESKFLLNLGKTFAEILGIATDARTTAENTRSELSQSVARIDKDLTDKGASINLIVSDGKVKGEVLIKAINNESSVKIKADNILFEGQKLNIKVESTNIDGKLKAEQIDADGIKAKDVDLTGTITALLGQIGEWTLGEADIPISSQTTIKETSLYSGVNKYDLDNLDWYTVETWLTAKGVYSLYKYYGNDGTPEGMLINTNYYSSKWWEILQKTNTESPSEEWEFTLEDGTSVIKEVCIK